MHPDPFVWISALIVLSLGFVLGFAAAWALGLLHSKTAKEYADRLLAETEALRRADRDQFLQTARATFGNLSLEALSTATEEFLKLAASTLAAERNAGSKDLEIKKGLIDQQLQRMTHELEHVSKIVKDLEQDRIEKFGQLTNQLKATGERTAELAQVTAALREALASSRVRGQWGERMAEDILRIAGFVENVNYRKQKAVDGGRTRPDFTFLLPRGLTVNMDVKFPLDNYLGFLNTESKTDQERYKNLFLRDVRARIKEVTSRDYISPEQNTVDCVLLFIPNEQIYTFIHEQDSTLFEQAIENHVVLCSPITLFAVLAVIRQAVEHFSFTQTSYEILSLLGRFKKQWRLFVDNMEALGRRLADTRKEYEALVTTRKRKLEKSLEDIEALRVQKEIPIAPQQHEEEDVDR